MRAELSMLLLTALALVGCDRITGAGQQKIFDAEAIGYACRVSLKAPEDCMKENETHSPTSLLAGWKAANKDIDGQLIDPSMGKQPARPIEAPGQPVVAGAENKTEAGKPKAETGKPSEKAAESKNAKPAAAKPEASVKPKATGH
jgi:hypothetical protein